MRKVREVLRLHFECGRSQREIARSLSLGSGTVSDYLKRAREAGVDWTAASAMAETELEKRLFRYPKCVFRSSWTAVSAHRDHSHRAS